MALRLAAASNERVIIDSGYSCSISSLESEGVSGNVRQCPACELRCLTIVRKYDPFLDVWIDGLKDGWMD